MPSVRMSSGSVSPARVLVALVAVLGMASGWTSPARGQESKAAETKAAPNEEPAKEADDTAPADTAAEKVMGKTIPEWIKLLGHDDEETREEAIDALLSFEDASPVKPLVSASAAMGGKIFATKYIEFTEQDQNLLDGLDEVMFEIGPDAVDELVELLGDQNNDFRRASAAQFLGVLGTDAKAAAPALQKALSDKNEAVRDMAAWALGEMQDLSAKASLEKLLTDASPLVQVSAALSLSVLGELEAAADEKATPPKIHPALLKALAHEDEFVRGYAAKSVGALGSLGVDALPALEKLLKDKNPNIRFAAAAAFWDISGQPTVLPVIVELLEAKEAGVRESAVAVLGEMKENARTALAALRKVVENDSSRRVRSAARAAIDSIRSAAPDKPPET